MSALQIGIVLVVISAILLLVSVFFLLVLPNIGSKLHYKGFGYIDTPNEPPERKLFGTVEYKVMKFGRGETGLRVSNNPKYYKVRDKLQSIVEKQDGKECKVCGEEIERFERKSLYKETWRAKFILGIMFSFEYVDSDAYCSEHSNSEVSFNVS